MSNEAAFGPGARAGTLDSASKPRLYNLLSKLGQPRVAAAVLALSLVLVSPALFSGFALDDYWLLDALRNPERDPFASRGPFDLFRFTTSEKTHALIDGGGFAWWSAEGTQFAFMRPLSSLTHTVDHWLWPNSALLMHLHSVLWFALLLAAVVFAYSKILPNRWTLGLATAMFALDLGHAAPVGWIAARNALISGVFATLCIAFHHDVRSRAGAGRVLVPMVAAIACAALGVLGGELGYGVAGYLAAYALLYDRASLRSRVLSLLPYALVLGALAVLRMHGGYRVAGGFVAYVDPIHETARFLRVLPVRVPLLFASQLSSFSADFHGLTVDPVRTVIFAFSLALCVFGAWFCLSALREDRASRFLALGAVLSAIPEVGGVASDRLLLLIGFGVLPVLAEAIRLAIAPSASAGATPRPRAAAAVIFLLVHLGSNPLLLPVAVCMPAYAGLQPREIADALPIDPAKKQTVILTGLLPAAALYALAMRSTEGKPNPERFYWLFGGGETAELTRINARVLRVSNQAGIFNANWDDRSPDLPLHAGDRVSLTDMNITVQQVTPDGRPTVVQFDFRQPLESDNYIWMRWNRAKLERYAPPSAGNSQAVATAGF